jgi:hypothetical protein
MHASLLKLLDNWVRTLIHYNDRLSTFIPFLFYKSFSFYLRLTVQR